MPVVNVVPEMNVISEMLDPDLIPPRPEEEMAAAESYRLCQRGTSTEFDVLTPYGHELLRYTDGRVEGFDSWVEPLHPAEAHELTREILALFAP